MRLPGQTMLQSSCGSIGADHYLSTNHHESVSFDDAHGLSVSSGNTLCLLAITNGNRIRRKKNLDPLPEHLSLSAIELPFNLFCVSEFLGLNFSVTGLL